MPVAVQAAMGSTWRWRLTGWTNHAAAKPLTFLLCLGPLAYWIWAGAQDALGTNPAETLLRGRLHLIAGECARRDGIVVAAFGADLQIAFEVGVVQHGFARRALAPQPFGYG